VNETTGVTPVTRLLPVACLAAAICLFASEMMTTFEFTPPGGEALSEQDGADRHGNALALIAVFAIGALVIAVLAASKPAATAVAVAGVIGLLVFLLVDLPDANAVGTLDDARQSFFAAEAVPQGGFWMALVSSLALALTGIALATLTPEQLAALRPGRLREREERETPAKDEAVTEAAPAAGHDSGGPASDAAAGTRLPHRRPRTRQRG
jgi:hypothetical protein